MFPDTMYLNGEIFMVRNYQTIFNTVLNNTSYLVNPFPNQTLYFKSMHYKPFENTVGKGEIARYEQFLLCPKCFLPIWRTFCHLHQI